MGALDFRGIDGRTTGLRHHEGRTRPHEKEQIKELRTELSGDFGGPLWQLMSRATVKTELNSSSLFMATSTKNWDAGDLSAGKR